MIYERLHGTFIGIVATFVDSIAVAEFAGYWLHRLLHSDRFPVLSRPHLIHHFLRYGPPFVIAQGVFQVPFVEFVVGTFVGRGALFFMEGFLGVRYGATAREFVVHQKFASIAIVVALIAIFLAIRWFPNHRRNQQSPTV
jgi:hypothetical protein